MSTDENKAIVRRALEIWNTGELDALDEVIALRCPQHWGGATIEPDSGPNWFRWGLTTARSEFPDYRLTVDDMFGAGDRVAARWTQSGRAAAGLQIARSLADAKAARRWEVAAD